MKACGTKIINYCCHSPEITLWNLADLHVGAVACAEGILREDIKEIANDPFALWVGGGDYAEWINVKCPHFDTTTVAPWLHHCIGGDITPAVQERIIELFWPIRDKCLGLAIGNHERNFMVHGKREGMFDEIAIELGVQNLGYSGIMGLKLCRVAGNKVNGLLVGKCDKRVLSARKYTLCVFHGSGAAQTPGGKINTLDKLMRITDADITFCGHLHDQLGRRQNTITTNRTCSKLESISRIGLMSGSYLKTYSEECTTYGEVRGYLPTCLGAAKVIIKPAINKVYAII